jgi:hypothetical protein
LCIAAKIEDAMPADLGHEPGCDARLAGGWRAIAAAWAVMLVLLFAGFAATAALRDTAPARPAAARLVIPQHDALCAGWYIDAAPNPDPCRAAPSLADAEEWAGRALW